MQENGDAGLDIWEADSLYLYFLRTVMIGGTSGQHASGA